MAISVKRIALWRGDVEDRAGTLAGLLAGQSGAGASLQVVMGYRVPGEESHAVVEIYPVLRPTAQAAARDSGLRVAPTPTLLVVGDDRPGLGYALTRSLADAGINLSFLVAQVVGRKYSAVIGFESEADANSATRLLRKAAASRPARKPAASRRSHKRR